MTQFKTVEVRPITTDEKEFCQLFQEYIKFIHDNLGGAFKTKKKLDIGQYKRMRRELKRYHNLPYAYLMFNEISNTDRQLKSIFEFKTKSKTKKLLPDLLHANQQMENAFLNGNVDFLISHTNSMKQLNDAVDNMIADPIGVINQTRNPYHIENPLFFGSNSLIRQFESSDMEDIASLDLGKFKYTYLTLPDGRTSDFQYIVHFMKELKATPEPIELNKEQFVKYTKFVYDNNEFESLVKMVKDYLRGNKKELIPNIIDKLKDFPDLYKTNELRKEQITKVYRGLGFGEEDDMPGLIQIEKLEKKNKYVATTDDYYVAKKFALQLGHLESDDDRRSAEGLIITYRVDKSAVVLDTAIFGGLFNEDEIIIDATKAEAIEHDYI